MTRLTAAALAAMLVAACANSPATKPRTGMNLSGYSQAFRDGYADGCASANAARKRDEPRFGSDPNYATGWQDGFSICRSK